MRIGKSGGIPLYVQIRERLRAELDEMESDAPIPSEPDLEKKFNVSRITIRRAIEDLAAEGLLIRKQGRGTFVQRRKFTHELSGISSWTEQLKRLGFSPKTAHRKVRIEPAPSHLTETLRLSPDERVACFERVRLAAREPISHMINYVPMRLLPGFSVRQFSGESLYEFLEHEFGLAPAVSIDTVGARTASDEEADALHIEPKAPVLIVRRVSYLEDGTPLELAIVVSRGDRYEYQVSLEDRSRRVRVPELFQAALAGQKVDR
ncbi:MAG TPA: GntR family transcriptional regulator [Alloacidobacterium sp.]|jgi:GntR family transcriptional regulator|nr:GntR family transcriptional regulator [Alloacidobacterium sp.]